MTMPANRSMFWRILRRLISSNCGRLFVILLALGAGAAVSAALLNLQVDAKHRLTSEFRSFGANVLITPRDAGFGATIDEKILSQLPPISSTSPRVDAVAFLYLIADVFSSNSQKPSQVVVAGAHGRWADDLTAATKVDLASPERQLCSAGGKIAALKHLSVGDRLVLRNGGREESCQIALIFAHGEAEDSQILPHLDVAQRLADLPGRISLVQLTVPGTPREIEGYIGQLQQRLPNASVRPIRQFTEAQAKIYSRISGVLTATVVVVLLLTTLCVLAAMTNVAMERKQDVAMMKAIGGSARRVTHIFFAEAAILGLAGGLIGAAAGIALSIGLGKAVFGVAAQPRLIVYPVSVALTLIVAILASYPLRHLANVKPASIFRGDA